MGIVYVVRNPAFMHLFKIGKTEKTVKKRGLNSSNVPEDFEIMCEYKCKDAKGVENKLHKAFATYRHTTKTGRLTEFFSTNCLDNVIGLLDVSGTKIDNKKSQTKSKKASKTTFSMLGLQPGTILVFTLKTNEKCLVKNNDSTVEYEGNNDSLSRLALKLHKKHKLGNSKAYNGWLFFKVKGENETLAKKRERLNTLSNKNM